MAGALTAAIAAAFSGGAAPSTDDYFEYTTLLLPGSGTNGAQNNTFLDGSTNNFTITRNGNTTQGTFSPFSQTGWGNYFDGNGDFLSTSASAISSVGANNFSFECFVYCTRQTNTYAQGLISYGVSGDTAGTSYISFQLDSSGYLAVSYATIGSFALTDTALFPLNQWVHAVVCRSGSTLSLFVNGTRKATTSTSATVGSTGNVLYIGSQWYANDPLRQLQGYISNARILNGTSAYDATQTTITVPTAPLTAISGTSLLTCQSNRFKDNSSNNFTITPNADVKVVAFSPFNPTASWSAATYGGSGYFDGSGDYLSIANNSAFDFGSGDFSIEVWIYVPNVSGAKAIITKDDAARSWIFVLNNADALFAIPASTTSTLTNAVQANTWVHLYFGRSGNTMYKAVNGSVSSDPWTTTIPTTSTAVEIGRQGGYGSPFTGYISGLRVLKGSAAYTSNFTPSAPPTAITNTVLLTNFTNAGIYDATSKNDLETVGNAQISTTQFQFAPSSMYLDGNGDYLIMPDAQTGQFLTGDFTVEYWCRFGSQGTNYAPQVGTLSSASPSGTWRFGTFTNNGGVYLAYHNGATYVDVQFGSTAYNDNTWRHFALTRSGTTVRAFVNGTQVGTNQTVSQNFNSSNKVSVGAELLNPTYFNGYIQDLRITKGYARYTANFTAPTAAFPTL